MFLKKFDVFFFLCILLVFFLFRRLYKLSFIPHDLKCHNDNDGRHWLVYFFFSFFCAGLIKRLISFVFLLVFSFFFCFLTLWKISSVFVF